MHRLLTSVLLAAALTGLSGIASADTLLIQRVKQEPANMPHRGMTAAQVERAYGAPQQRLAPAGGQRRAWPAISRWVYPAFTVYLEHGHVIDAVANKVGPEEIGPKPASS